MEFTNKELIGATDAIKLIMQMDWPMKQSFALAQMVKDIDDAIVPSETVRQNLVKKHGVQKENGNWTVDENDADAYQKFTMEYGEVLKEKVEVAHAPVKLRPSNSMTMKPALLLALGGLVTLEETDGD